MNQPKTVQPVAERNLRCHRCGTTGEIIRQHSDGKFVILAECEHGDRWCKTEPFQTAGEAIKAWKHHWDEEGSTR